MNPHLHNAADLEKIAKLEAEVVDARWRFDKHEDDTGAGVLQCKDHIKNLEAVIRCQTARAEKAEAELAAHRIAKDAENPGGYRVVPGSLYDEVVARAEKAEAEVERLRHLGGAPPGVSPSPPRMCEACERDDHANCGSQTWCECDCDPFTASVDSAFWNENGEPAARRERDDG